jgi:hypothetical protein
MTKNFGALVEGRFGGNKVGFFSPLPATGFAGVSFRVNGQTDFGWIRLKVTDGGAGDGFPHQLTAVDWAYDNTGAPIRAGETHASSAAVPEPSTFALALLGAGFAGVLAWRRRRQAVAAADS